MSLISQLGVRTVSTLIATLTTVIIITERQRRISNAKIELAARYLDGIDHETAGSDLCKQVVQDLENADELIREITWGQISRASKIDEVVRITRKLAHEIHLHRQLEERCDLTNPADPLRDEIEHRKFHSLASSVRALKISFIDFIFIGRAPKPRHPQGPAS
jgi:hypothetical protein